MSQKIRSPLAAASAALLLSTGCALAQGGAAGQGGLSPDTPVLAPTPPGASGSGGPKTPLPPRDTPRAPQPGQSAGGDGPKTPLPPRDTPRAAQPGQRTAAVDPDWPCVQVKIPTLSYGQMWAGPSIEEALKSWRNDKDVEELVTLLAARRTKIEEARAEIEAYAKGLGEERDAKLAEVFAGVFDVLNAERSQVMIGISRYSQKQRALSDRIRTERIQMADKFKDLASQQSQEAQTAQNALDWDTRIYEERTQSLTYVCETPVILEQRAFELGREIQAHLAANAK